MPQKGGLLLPGSKWMLWRGSVGVFAKLLSLPRCLDARGRSAASRFLSVLCYSIGLPPAVLADVVVSNMAHLPSKEDVMGSEPQGPGHRSGNALLEGLMKVRI